MVNGIAYWFLNMATFFDRLTGRNTLSSKFFGQIQVERWLQKKIKETENSLRNELEEQQKEILIGKNLYILIEEVERELSELERISTELESLEKEEEKIKGSALDRLKAYSYLATFDARIKNDNSSINKIIGELTIKLNYIDKIISALKEENKKNMAFLNSFAGLE